MVFCCFSVFFFLSCVLLLLRPEVGSPGRVDCSPLLPHSKIKDQITSWPPLGNSTIRSFPSDIPGDSDEKEISEQLEYWGRKELRRTTAEILHPSRGKWLRQAFSNGLTKPFRIVASKISCSSPLFFLSFFSFFLSFFFLSSILFFFSSVIISFQENFRREKSFSPPRSLGWPSFVPGRRCSKLCVGLIWLGYFFAFFFGLPLRTPPKLSPSFPPIRNLHRLSL